MRPYLPLAAILLLAGTAQAHAQSERLFISPMGEPFRGGEDTSPETAWFKGVDANADGKLTPEEMTIDAERFFKLLDLDSNGEIDPTEMQRYETMILPEVGMGSGGTMPRDPARDGPDSFATGAQPSPQRRYAAGGAARFSYIAIPQPVLAADTNFNRGVSAQEFGQAARRRFKLLDADSDGILVASELPRPPQSKARKRR